VPEPENVLLVSSLPLAVCLRRLEDAIDTSVVPIIWRKPVIGRIHGHTVDVYKRSFSRKGGARPSTRIFATLEEENGNTNIFCELKKGYPATASEIIGLIVLGIFLIPFGFIFLLALIGFMINPVGALTGPPLLYLLLSSPLWLGLLLTWYNRRIRRPREWRFLIGFLRETLGAEQRDLPLTPVQGTGDTSYSSQ
jgi:hypothetical protein